MNEAPRDPVNSKRLLYTIAFDPPSSTLVRCQAKVFLASVLKSDYCGDIIVFTNSEIPLTGLPLRGVTEIPIETGEMSMMELSEFACAFKYRAVDFIEEPEFYDRIVYTDCDCLALSNLDSFFSNETDIQWTGEKGTHIGDACYRGYFTAEELSDASQIGVNAGTWSIRGKVYPEVMRGMLQFAKTAAFDDNILWGDQPAWNKYCRSSGYSHQQLPLNAVHFPLAHHHSFHEYMEADLLHFCGGTVRQKVAMQWGLYCAKFLGKSAPLLAEIQLL